MKFNKKEKVDLLSINGVGPTVVKRLEEIGIHSFAELKEYTVEDIVDRVASMLKTTCWKNSPKAKSAIQGAIDLANKE